MGKAFRRAIWECMIVKCDCACVSVRMDGCVGAGVCIASPGRGKSCWFGGIFGAARGFFFPFPVVFCFNDTKKQRLCACVCGLSSCAVCADSCCWLYSRAERCVCCLVEGCRSVPETAAQRGLAFQRRGVLLRGNVGLVRTNREQTPRATNHPTN